MTAVLSESTEVLNFMTAVFSRGDCGVLRENRCVLTP
jgi:hypothetical protein